MKNYKKIIYCGFVLLFLFGCIFYDRTADDKYRLSKNFPIKEISNETYNLSAQKTLDNYFKNNTQIKIQETTLENISYSPYYDFIPGGIQVCWGTVSSSNYSLIIHYNNNSFELGTIVRCVHTNGSECKNNDLEEKYKTQEMPCHITFDYKTVKNPKYCHLLENEEYCIIQNVFKKEHIVYCHNLSNYRKKDCYATLALNNKNISFCNYLKGEEYEYCISNSIYLPEHIVYCQNLNLTTNRLDIEKCYLNLAVNSGNDSICEEIEFYKNVCYSRVAEKQQNVSICNKITDYSKDSCYNSLAKIMNNVSICDYGSARNACIYTLARNKNNLTICKNIDKESHWYNTCFKHFGEEQYEKT
ncbi:hypothetical protein KO317_01525 [Candidatus Micrarchaeota archaeon]|jgi:hypothetical protein|nr:hypothetical protein [Candidatus Micrarchaeota archaeon]